MEERKGYCDIPEKCTKSDNTDVTKWLVATAFCEIMDMLDKKVLR
jgi:hypothetical protein